MNVIELAKSNRSSCKTCKEKIEKLTPRLGIENVFMMRGNEVKSLKWHHLHCALEKHSEAISEAELKPGLDETTLKLIEKNNAKHSGGLSLIPISSLEESGIRVNTEANVIRAMKVREVDISHNGDDLAQTVYVKDEEQRRKITLWGSHIKLKLNKEDRIVIIYGLTELGSDEKILVNVDKNSKILLNPTEKEINEALRGPEKFVAESWDRPGNEKVKFEIAKTSRARCNSCEEKITKGELKITKPVWMENEKTKQKFPSAYSLHIPHVLEDDQGEDVLKEALSSLNYELISEFKEQLEDLVIKINNSEINKELKKLLEN